VGHGVWKLGVGALALACALALWLQRPLEPSGPAEAEEPVAPAAAVRAAQPGQAQARSQPVSRPPTAQPVAPPPAEALPPPLPAAPAGPVSYGPADLAEQLRLRLVRALRTRHPTPLARREAVLAELRASGESQEPWTEPARAALEHMHTQIAAEVLPFQAEPAGCYAAGCALRVTFPDSQSFTEAQRRVPALSPGGGVGPHMQLPPEPLPSGEVVGFWLVLRPQPAEAP
jgi:hypothetical protein